MNWDALGAIGEIIGAIDSPRIVLFPYISIQSSLPRYCAEDS